MVRLLEQGANPLFSFVVIPLAKVVKTDVPGGIDEVVGGPVFIVEAAPDAVVVIHRDGIAETEILNCLAHVRLILFEGKFRSMYADDHRGVLLSSAGKKRALEVVRHHRLIETFLYQVLDYPIDEVHEEAERLEHFISERFEERIAAKLGHPKIDPHGHCIPAMDGAMPKQNSIQLINAIRKGIYVVESVSDRNARTLSLLKDKGIAPGVRLHVKELTNFTVSVGRSSKVLNLDEEAAASIRVCALRT
jgi:Iron dependent repressor, metal binding and dimerisation domain